MGKSRFGQDIVVNGSSTVTGSATVGGDQTVTGSHTVGVSSTVTSNQSIGGSLAVGTTGAAGTGAILDVQSTTKGFLPPRMTTTQRNAISGPTIGLTVFNSTTNKLNVYNGTAWVEVGSGSGQGGINYISANNGNADFETDASGWSAYANTAQALPVTGTGGTPNITITRTTTSPLRGTASGLITKDAVNRQGQGISYSFSIDPADQAKMMSISFDYTIVSGTYSGGSPTTDSDLEVYIYDVTNNQIIQPTAYKITGSVIGQNYKHSQCTFQTASNSTSYRLILHIPTTSASAWSLTFDNVQVGPQTYASGAPVSDFAAFTSTITNLTSPTQSMFYRRVGDSIEIKGRITSGGTSAGSITFTLPSGLSIDFNKLWSGNFQKLAHVTATSNVGISYQGTTRIDTTTTNRFSFISSDGSANVWGGTVPFNPWGSGFTIDVESLILPIAGWSSVVQLGQDAETRLVAARIALSSATVSFNRIPFDIINFDTHSAYIVGTGYRVPIPGIYRVGVVVQTTATAQCSLSIDKNGSNAGYLTQTGSLANQINGNTGLVSCLAGDILNIKNDAASISYNGNTAMTVERLSGPAQIAASEVVLARYTTAAGQSLANSTTTIIDFGLRYYDSHSSVQTGGSWRFVAPTSGIFQINCHILFNSVAWAANQSRWMELYKNGIVITQLDNVYSEGSATEFATLKGMTSIKLLQGDYVDVRVTQNRGAATSLYNSDPHNYIEITKVGNYI